MDLFTLTAKLGLDTSDYETKIADVVKSAKEAGGAIDTALGGGTETAAAVGTAVSTAQTKAGTFGETLGAILASGVIQDFGSAVFDAGKKTIESASSLKEAQNFVDIAFKDSASTIDTWAKTTAGNYGLSEYQAKTFTANYGNMFRNLGVDEAQAAEMAMNLAGLAGDMTSVLDFPDIETAYQKIFSGITGESEPLREIVDMRQSAIEDYLGVKFSDMSAQEQLFARYQYLMDMTKSIQGDYARTKDSYANATRTFQNNVDSLSAKIGESVLPLAESGINFANSLFDTLLSESTEDTLSGIDKVMADTTAEIEKSASAARAATAVLAEYGDKTALTAEQQKQWEAIATELVRTIPELGSLINMQTGEIEGGTEALYENISAWEESGKAAAQDSSLEAKRDMLKGIGDEIAREQGLLAISQKQMEQHAGDMAGVGAMIAKELGVEYDGTAEGFASMMDSMAAFYAAQSLGYSDLDITTLLSDYASAKKEAEDHTKKISELQTEYSTVEAGIGESTAAIESSVDSLGETVTDTFGSVETATDSLIEGFDQSEAAYTNAYNTGIGAANGLNDAYGSFSDAANAYASASSRIGGGLSIGAERMTKLAVGMDYVPYDEYPAQLHEGEAVLTKAEASDWRRGGSVQGPTAAEIGAAVAESMRETLNGLGVYMGADRVGDLVTDRVSRNIARNAHKRRFDPV